MKDIFEFKRFGLLFKKTILERPLQFVGLIGLVLLVTLVIYAGVLYTIGWVMAQNMAFIWGGLGGGCFLTAIIFGYFNTNASGAAYLTLPASAFEKWLCGVVIAGILFPMIFLVFYRVIDTCFVASFHNGLNKNDAHYKEIYDSVQIFTFGNFVIHQVAIMYVNFAGAMMVGSLYFNKISAIKTALVYCGVLAVIYFTNFLLANVMFQNVVIAFPFHNMFIHVGNDDASLELPSKYMDFVQIAIQFIIPAVLWITAFIRLREKEI
jgi:hypothetical protein